jgi:hypothetical protein
MSINKKYLCIVACAVLCMSANSFAQTNVARSSKGSIKASDDSSKPVAGSETAVLPPIMSPTLDEIAEAQRLKQRSDIAKIKAEAAVAASTAKAAADVIATAEKNSKAAAVAAAELKKKPNKNLPAPVVIPSPTHRLLSIYKVKGKWMAEFFEGTGIVTSEVGERFGSFVVEDINASSVKLTGDKKGQVTVTIGTSF